MTGQKVIRPTAKQIEAKKIATDPEKQIILYGGAIRGGKSYWLILMLHSYCILYKGSKWLLIRQSLPTLRRTLIPTFNKLFDEGISAYIRDYNQQTQTVTYKNGSQIIFMAENYDHDKELNRFKGLEINGAGIDEINEIREETFNKIIERAGSNILEFDVPIKILATCNPSHNWVKEKFYDRWANNMLPKSWAYIPAKITDNPYVPESYLISLQENLPNLMYQKFVDGDWDIIENDAPFADNFSYEKHVSDETIFNPDRDIYLCFDFNITNTCLIIQTFDKSIRIIKEYHVKGWDLERLCLEIKTDYPNSLFLINGDASGRSRSALTSGNVSAYQIIKSKLILLDTQIRVPSANPSHINSRILTNVAFKNMDVKIHPDCRGLIRDLQCVKIVDGGKIDKSDEGLTHWLDPFRYHLHYEHYYIIRHLGIES